MQLNGGINSGMGGGYAQNNFVTAQPQGQMVQPTYSNTTFNNASYNTSRYPMIIGKVINTEQDIAPNEVPNDGRNVGVFVQSDLQKVYIRQVGGDGLIHGNTYILDNSQQETAQEANILQTILERLDGIEKKLNYRKPSYNKNNKPRNNQEGKNNE